MSARTGFGAGADAGWTQPVFHDARRPDATDLHVRTDELATIVVPPLVQGCLKLPRETRVLDVGCGAGSDVAYFAEVFDSVVGLDPKEHAEWEALVRRAPNASFVCESILEHDGTYDLVVDNGCFGRQLPRLTRAYLDAMARLASNGGIYVVSTYRNENLASSLDETGRRPRYFSDAELHGELDLSGFTVFEELDVWRSRDREFCRLTFCRTPDL
jgi:SAM-dependent methyltransferase